jgi:hypothetical protein
MAGNWNGHAKWDRARGHAAKIYIAIGDAFPEQLPHQRRRVLLLWREVASLGGLVHLTLSVDAACPGAAGDEFPHQRQKERLTEMAKRRLRFEIE